VQYVILLALFAFGFLTYSALLAKRNGITYGSQPLLVAGFFAVLSIFTWVQFSPISNNFFTALLSAASVMVLLVFYGYFVLSYFLVRRYGLKPAALIARSPLQVFLQLRYRFLFAKSFDVLFQQLVFYIFLMLLVRDVGIGWELITLFMALIGLAHLPLAFIQGIFWASFYAAFSTIGALFFSWLILYVPLGITFSFLIHFGFYVVVGLLAWRGKPKLDTA
jgi:hypothetical protein